MPETIIGSGPDLENLVIGLDTIVLNESKHWYRSENGKLYARAKIVKQKDGEYRIYMTGDPEPKLRREFP